MRHDAHGWWIPEAGTRRPPAAPRGRVEADVVIVGGGYLGLWSAWYLIERERGARVVVLEAEAPASGPRPQRRLRQRAVGQACRQCRRPLRRGRRRGAGPAAAAVHAIGAWCAAQERRRLVPGGAPPDASAAPAQDGAWAEEVAAARRLGGGDEFVELTAGSSPRAAPSPLLRGGAMLRPRPRSSRRGWPSACGRGCSGAA